MRRIPRSRSHRSQCEERGEGVRAVFGIEHPEESRGVGIALRCKVSICALIRPTGSSLRQAITPATARAQ
jgi:hypothetical protein